MIDSELKKVVISRPQTLGNNHDNLEKEKLEPLQAYLGLSDEELKKVVVSMPEVLSQTMAAW